MPASLCPKAILFTWIAFIYPTTRLALFLQEADSQALFLFLRLAVISLRGPDAPNGAKPLFPAFLLFNDMENESKFIKSMMGKRERRRNVEPNPPRHVSSDPLRLWEALIWPDLYKEKQMIKIIPTILGILIVESEEKSKNQKQYSTRWWMIFSRG
ncbi:hypothetical protein K1719_025648 [Acacia pycnantha]|nr:hypothetical protein K1719_025648 [Acacia pycnantha]